MVAWQTHKNFDGPAAVLLGIHAQFRNAAARLQTLEPAQVPRLFVPLAETLHHHHHAEEAMLFPLVTRKTGTAPAQLVSDHETLTAAIEAVEAALRSRSELKAVLATFCEVLIEHLDREEQLVIPVLLAMSPAEAWGQIHGG